MGRQGAVEGAAVTNVPLEQRANLANERRIAGTQPLEVAERLIGRQVDDFAEQGPDRVVAVTEARDTHGSDASGSMETLGGDSSRWSQARA